MKEVLKPDEAEGAEETGLDLGDLEKTLSEIDEAGEEPHLYLCPVCGVLLSDDASECPRCGAEFLEDEEEEEDEEEPSKTHLCIECGSFVDEGATSCPNCGVEIIRGEPRPEKVEEEPDIDEADLEAELRELGLEPEPEEAEPEPEEAEPELELEEPEPEEAEPEPEPEDIGEIEAEALEVVGKLGEEEVGKPKPVSDGLFLCPRCGAFLRADAESCEICGASLVEKKKIGVGDIDKIAPEIPEKDIGMCPTCGAFLDPETEKCEICDAEVMEKVEKEADELLAELVPDMEETEGEPPVLEEDVPEEDADVEPGDIDVEIDDFFDELESIEMEKTIEEARLPPEPELVAEVDLGEVEATLEELPKLAPRGQREELILKGKAKERARRVSWAKRGKGLSRLREYGVFAAVISCGIEYIALQFRPPFFEWILIFLFAILLAVGLSFLTVSFGKISKRLLKNSLLLWVGTILVIIVPLLHFVGVLSSESVVDYGLIIAGLALSVVGIYLMGRGIQTHMIWTAGCLIILVSAVPLAFKLGSWPPSPGMEMAMFVVGSAFVLTSFGFILYDKWLKVVMDTQILFGDESMKRRDATESVKSYDAAIKASSSLSSAADTPSNFDLPWYSKGAALTILGRYEEALEHIDTALKINPRNEVAWVNKGTAMSRLGRHKEALKCFNAAIKQNPAYEVAWNNKGNTLARLKNYDEALKCYDTAIEIDEMYKEAWVNKGYILAKLGRYEDAARCADFVTSFASTR
ncbi:MAG: tetratricopeptide repeat protein [Methanomassiliicoccales archaeon]|nr:MAG: tetratricopeptide repeat protein [Methanomassiliicoccales archaeon]